MKALGHAALHLDKLVSCSFPSGKMLLPLHKYYRSAILVTPAQKLDLVPSPQQYYQ